MSDAVWDGTNATRNKGEGSNLYTDYAYIGIPLGAGVTFEGGLMPVDYTKFSIWDRRKDMFRVKWANDMTEVVFDYMKSLEYTDAATDTIDDNDVNWLSIYVNQKFAGDWAVRAQVLYHDDQRPGDDMSGLQAYGRVEGAAGPMALEAELTWLSSDSTGNADDGMGGYVQGAMKFGATSVAFNGGFTKDGFMADDDFGFIMIGGASAITPSVTANVGGNGDTLWLGGIFGFQASESLSLKGILAYADIDTPGTNDITAFEVSGGMSYAISDGAAFDWVVGYLNLDDDAGALENPFGTAVTLSLSF